MLHSARRICRPWHHRVLIDWISCWQLWIGELTNHRELLSYGICLIRLSCRDGLDCLRKVGAIVQLLGRVEIRALKPLHRIEIVLGWCILPAMNVTRTDWMDRWQVTISFFCTKFAFICGVIPIRLFFIGVRLHFNSGDDACWSLFFLLLLILIRWFRNATSLSWWTESTLLLKTDSTAVPVWFCCIFLNL